MKSDTPPAPTASAEVKKGATVTEVFGDVSHRVVATEVSQGDLKGYFVRPKNIENAPGIVMIHEWWGLNETIREMARVLASEGYQVFAIDLYGEVATTPEKARELATLSAQILTLPSPRWNSQLAYLKTQQKHQKSPLSDGASVVNSPSISLSQRSSMRPSSTTVISWLIKLSSQVSLNQSSEYSERQIRV
jgi:hypothetical protein